MDQNEDDTAGGALAPLAAPRLLAEDAADRIREQILAGGFRQGEHLIESRIAKQLSISRGPVREALMLLRAEGLVEDEPRRGTFVVRLESGDVRKIYQLRAAIEGYAAKLLARSADQMAISELRDLVEMIERAVSEGDQASVSRADLAFHDGVCRLSGNQLLSEVFVRYVPVLRGLLRLDERVYSSLDEIGHQHRPMLAAIEGGDAKTATALFEEHCERAGELVAGYIDSLSEHPPSS